MIYCVKGKGNFVADGSEIQESQQKELLEGLVVLAQRAEQLGFVETQWQQTTARAWQQCMDAKKNMGKSLEKATYLQETVESADAELDAREGRESND